jgi:hypothetical protein
MAALILNFSLIGFPWLLVALAVFATRFACEAL